MRRKSEDGVKLSYERLKEVLDYDSGTGAFTWKVSTNRRYKAGRAAGFVTSQGYRAVVIDGSTYLCGRLAWYYSHNEWPAHQVSHINGDKTDDRLANLALVVPLEKDGRTISRERVMSLMRYEPDTGRFIWLVATSPRVKVGDEAGVIAPIGYRYLSLDGQKFLAHRLAWFVVHDEWPSEMIDHINGIRHDNRIANLRKASNRENTRNSRMRSTNRSGVKGVSFHRRSGKWLAQITSDYRIYPLGKFDTLEEAAEAYKRAALKYHGEFAKT